MFVAWKVRATKGSAMPTIITATALTFAAIGSSFFGSTVAPSTPDAGRAEAAWISCTSGNFEGRARVTIEHGSLSSTARVDQYQIFRRNGQGGGNKANVDLRIQNSAATSPWSFSPDSMKQDGGIYPVSLFAAVPKAGAATASVEFVFDKSGSDPRCTARRAG
jgi:hypothetical protein